MCRMMELCWIPPTRSSRNPTTTVNSPSLLLSNGHSGKKRTAEKHREKGRMVLTSLLSHVFITAVSHTKSLKAILPVQ